MTKAKAFYEKHDLDTPAKRGAMAWYWAATSNPNASFHYLEGEGLSRSQAIEAVWRHWGEEVGRAVQNAIRSDMEGSA